MRKKIETHIVLLRKQLNFPRFFFFIKKRWIWMGLWSSCPRIISGIFWKDGHICTLRQQLLSHFLLSFHLVSFLYSKHYTNWHCMRSGALLLHFFFSYWIVFIPNIHVFSVWSLHTSNSKSIGQFHFYRQYWDSGLCLPHWSPDFPQPIRESH